MNLVVIGLAPHNEAALGVFLSRVKPGWSWQSAPAGPGVTLPLADMYVADMVSLGLARWSERGQAELVRLFGASPAVLLLPSSERTWAAAYAAVPQHSLVWLPKPYGTPEMKAALEKAATHVGRTPALRAATPTPTPAPARAPAPAPAPPDMPDTAEQAPGLSVQEFQARLAALADGQAYVFLRQLSASLGENQPFEVRFTVLNSLIVHPAGEWIATNTPMAVIKRICQSSALASAVSVRPIDGTQAEQRVQRLGMPPLALDAFLHDLVAAALPPPP